MYRKIFKILFFFILTGFLAGQNLVSVLAEDVPESSTTDESGGDDFDLYQKYLLYQKYEKKTLYRKYLRYKSGKLGKQYKKYKKYKKYNKKSYNAYAGYGTQEYQDGYNRYRDYLNGRNDASGDLGEADLGGGLLGPDVTVGLTKYSKSALKSDKIKIKAEDENGAARAYNIKDKNNNLVAQIPASQGERTYVEYDGSDKLKVSNSITAVLVSDDELTFEPADGDPNTMVFDYSRPNSNYDKFRGTIKIKKNADGDSFWVINKLPMEHYVWGMGEITGTGPSEYNKVMTTSFRTYGYWKMKFSTKYAKDGFRVDATPGNQLYYGFEWEQNYPRIRQAALESQGHIVMYRKEIAITPYSSWTDGKTRSFKERWGSSDYPWCKSVKDSYGKHPSKSTKTLEAEGNHMVGLSANGALKLAKEKDWDWGKILRYYFSGITLRKVY